LIVACAVAAGKHRDGASARKQSLL